MAYVVIGAVDEKLDCYSATSPARALEIKRKLDAALYERVTVTDGQRFLAWSEIEAARNA